MKPSPITLYRDMPELSVARMRLYQARLRSGFQPVRLSDPATRTKPGWLRRLLSRLTP